jgi:hypothetical protein
MVILWMSQGRADIVIILLERGFAIRMVNIEKDMVWGNWFAKIIWG